MSFFLKMYANIYYYFDGEPLVHAATVFLTVSLIILQKHIRRLHFSAWGRMLLSSVLYLFCNNSLALYLCSLWVFELLGLIHIQEEVLQQTLSIAQLV